MTTVKKVAVIGAGVMGAGIAAQVANAGVDVVLMDIVPNGAADRTVIAKSAIEKLLKNKPAAFMHPRNAKRITPANTEDDMALLADCDWIIEVVIEKLDIKRALYKKIDKVRKKGSVVSSNTSTLPLHVLVDGMPKAFKQDFMITHFFNPPRYMRLLEVVTSSETGLAQAEAIRTFGDRMLGKSVVDCKDTPGFIANRIGTYWLHAAVTEAVTRKVDVESADVVLGKPAGIPKTGIFGLLDLVGIDLMPHVLNSMMDALPKTDAFHALGPAPQLMDAMIADGYTGRKGKGGFYRLRPDDPKKTKEVRDLQTGCYYAALKPRPAAMKAFKCHGLKGLLTHKSPEAEYAWAVLSGTLGYAADLVPEIADTIEQVDRAMCLGYNWKYGPFELLDKLGSGWFAERLKAEGRPVPKMVEVAKGRPFYRVHSGKKQFMGTDGAYHDIVRPDGVILLEDIKRASKPMLHNRSASVWDIGDGIACLEFHSKMNSFNPLIISLINKTVKELPKRGFKGLVIYNEGSNFSVGANLFMLVLTAKLRMWPIIDLILRHGQDAFSRLKYAPFPVVGAPSGMALGGGCEVLLHCNALTAHAETYIGLVEAGVGLIPGWGGCKELVGRHSVAKTRKGGPMPPVMDTFTTIATAKVATSADEAKDLMFLRPDDEVVMNRDRVLAAAKTRALAMAKDYTPPKPFTYTLPGPSGRAALELGVRDFAAKGIATPHDVTIAGQLAMALTGDKADLTDEPHTEAYMLRLERKGLVALTKTTQTRDRVVYMLKNGKPLRN
ncbi:MAG: 3-hydroxyacyl-CoA dehydrogenase [Proteobacteria bacterium]|nr:3-hydroxyacyl-CoA dehydrogenase [Pseudomonadota bacterium]